MVLLGLTSILDYFDSELSLGLFPYLFGGGHPWNTDLLCLVHSIQMVSVVNFEVSVLLVLDL